MIIGLVLLVIMIVVIVYANVTKEGYINDDVVVGLVVGVIVALAFLITGITCILHSLDYYAQAEAYAEVKQLYTATINSTADAVVRLDKTPLDVQQIAALVDVGVSVENLQHSTLTANRIAEARNYNRRMIENRLYYRRIYRHWFLRLFIAKPPASVLE